MPTIDRRIVSCMYRPARLLFGAAACLASAALAHGDTLATYTFAGSSLEPSFVANNMTASAITTPSNVGNSITFWTSSSSSVGGPTGLFPNGASLTLEFSNAVYEELAANAFAAGTYVSFTVTAAAGTTLDLAQISYGNVRTSSSPRRLSLYVKTSKEAGFTKRGDFNNSSSSIIRLSDYAVYDLAALGAAFSGVTSAEFRLVWSDDNPTGHGVGRLDNIALLGTVVLPSGTVLMLR